MSALIRCSPGDYGYITQVREEKSILEYTENKLKGDRKEEKKRSQGGLILKIIEKTSLGSIYLGINALWADKSSGDDSWNFQVGIMADSKKAASLRENLPRETYIRS